MEKFRTVIFDMDGTLLNTLEDLGDCMNRVLEREGFAPHPIDAYRHFVGDGMDNLVRRVLPPGGSREASLLERIRQQMEREYALHWADKTVLYPGIAELLSRLSARGIRMAILSNKPHPFTREIADHYLSEWTFDFVLGSRPGIPRKPDPAAALEICRAWKRAPGEVLYGGDTNTDMQMARRAGMFPVGVLWGFRDKAELLENGARELVGQPLDLLRFFSL